MLVDDYIKTKEENIDAYIFLKRISFFSNPIFKFSLPTPFSMMDAKDMYDDFYKIKSHRNKNYYHFIPQDSINAACRILDALAFAKRTGKDLKYFLDVGCGPAIILEIAELFGLKSFGIEISKVTAEFAEEKFPGKIFVGDAFDFDFSMLENTLIYTYMPIRLQSLMGELASKILSEINESIIWIEMLPHYPKSKGMIFKRNGNIYSVRLGNYGFDFYTRKEKIIG